MRFDLGNIGPKWFLLKLGSKEENIPAGVFSLSLFKQTHGSFRMLKWQETDNKNS